MTQAQQAPTKLSSADWATLDDLVNRYETAWRRGERPALAEGLPQAGALRLAALRELIHAELELRLKAGEAARVEDYLQRFPEVAAPAEVLGLLACEYELRRRREPHLGLDEYQRRFPQHIVALAARLQSVSSKSVAPAKPAQPPSRAITASADLVAVLTDLRLLDGAHLGDLRALQKQFADARALAKELVRRDWLTPWQVNQLFLRRAGDVRLGPYLLLDRLGEGGMGTVYRAQHSVMRRLVALKVIRRDRLAAPDSVRRFYREVRAVAQLSHPNIVLAHDAAEVNGTHFLVMEFVAGTDLAKLVRRQGALSVAQACEYARQTATGLQHAHEQGLVHRDIKPANLLLAAGGTVKVLDLGLARQQLVTGEQTVGELTGEGAVMGTPDDMAPEQASESHTVDIRADVYSLGCTLHFLLTGQVPFPGGTLAQKLVRHQQANPAPVERLRPEVPAALGEVLRRMMAKRPEDRCQTPAAAAAALLPFCPPGSSTGIGALSPEAQARVAAVRVTVVGTAAPGVRPEATITMALPAGASVARGGLAAWVGRSRRRLAGVGILLLLAFLLLLLRRGADPTKGAEENPGEVPMANNDPDFAVQGEYLGGSIKRAYGAEVIARGNGKFVVNLLGGLRGAGHGSAWWAGTATTEGEKVTVVDRDGKWNAVIAGGKMTGKDRSGEDFTLEKVIRKSNTLGLKPPPGAVVLFEGKDTGEWIDAKIVEGNLLGSNVNSKRKFKDHKVHLEFRLSFMPRAQGQGRSNSGVYLQQRYEVQVLDSFGLQRTTTACGAIYGEAVPRINMCYPPGQWQTYDIDFRAARFGKDGTKIENARISVSQNGVLIHAAVELKKGQWIGGRAETPEPGPLFLQDHGGGVQYRNIWVVETDQTRK